MRGHQQQASGMLHRPVKAVAHRLPFRLKFPRSGLYISVLPPLALGFCIGVLAAIMGVGGGFILIPAMIYLLRMPTTVVIGTSLFQVLIVACITIMLQATATQRIDLVLAAVLMLGGVIGAQFGARLGAGLKGEHLRALLGLILIVASLKFLWDLVIPPSEYFVLGAGML
jgi:uncharacterized membrane protein YfcA